MIQTEGNRGLCFEQLDARRLLAGDVTVVHTEFGYEITGDNEANSIRIERIAERQFRVQGENGTMGILSDFETFDDEEDD